MKRLSSHADAVGAYATQETEGTEEKTMPVWAWVLIIILIVFLLGGFGYRRRGR
jgi:purine-cytosine permease-like protein